MRSTVLSILVLATLHLVPARAHALSVLCYGDSITYGTPQSASYVAQLQLLRPDLELVNAGKPGDPSWDIGRFADRLAERHYDVVTIMIGTNDVALVPGYSPLQTFYNIWKMARLARQQGAQVLLLTQTPAIPPQGTAARQVHTRQVAYQLIKHLAGVKARGIHLADLRDEFTKDGWQVATYDGLHPNPYGANLIAEFLSAQIDTLPTPQ